jgi:hypothetical protein
MRSDIAIVEFVAHPFWFLRLQNIVEIWEDPTIVVSALRSMRLIFRSQNTYESMRKRFPDLGNWLIALLERFFKLDDVVEELLNTIRNFTRKPDYLYQIDPRVTYNLV